MLTSKVCRYVQVVLNYSAVRQLSDSGSVRQIPAVDMFTKPRRMRRM